jgi:hypothetical protein
MADLSRAPRRGEDILTAFKRLQNEVRRERIVSVNGGLLKQTEGGKTIEIKRANHGGYPFHVVSMGDGTIRVYAGRWNRNGYNVALTTDVGEAYLTVESVGDDDYVWLYLNSDASKDPALKPNLVQVVTNAALSYADNDKWGDNTWLLGKLTGGVWAQYWHGGDIDDLCVRPDGNTYAPTTDPARVTLEINPQTNAHEGELQMANADDAEASAWSLPHLRLDAAGSGPLAWAAMDTHRNATVSKSVEVVDVSGANVAQVRGWKDAAETAQSAGDLLLTQRVVSGARDAVYLDPADLSVSHATTADTATDVVNVPAHSHAHTDLTDMPDTEGVVTDHDARYWVKGGGVADCYGSAIGSAADTGVIDLANHELDGGWGTQADTSFEVKGSGSYKRDGHTGKTHAKKIILTDEDGTAVECYLRGGILCVD